MRRFLSDCRAVLRRPDARWVLCADTVSRSGDWLLYVAISLLLFREDGVGALGVFNALRIVLPIVVGPSAGRFGNRFPPRAVMIGADLVRALTLGAAGVAAIGGVRATWLLLAVLLCGLASACHSPAERRFQRDLVEPEDRAAVNAVIGTTGALVIVVAPAVGGLLSAQVGPGWLLVLDAASFVLSALLVGRVRVTRQPAAAEQVAATRGALRTAIGVLRDDRSVLACLLSQAAACVGAGASLVLLVPVAARFSGTDATVGWLTAAIGVGSVLGVPLGGPAAKRGRVAVAAACVALMGPLLGLFVSVSGLVVVVGLAVLLGLAANVPEPVDWTTYGTRVPEERSGSFYGLVESTIVASITLGGAAAGLIAAALGTVLGGWLIGSVTAVVGLGALVIALPAAQVAAPASDVPAAA